MIALVLLAALGVAAVLGIVSGVLVPRRLVDRVPLVVDVDADDVPKRMPRVPAGPAPGVIVPPLGPAMRTIPMPPGLRPLKGADDRKPTPEPERPSTVPPWMRGPLADALTAGGVPVAPSPTCTCGKAEVHDARHALPVATVVIEPDPDCTALACVREAWREKYRDEVAAAKRNAEHLAQMEAALRSLLARPLPPIAYLSEPPRVEFLMAERVGLAVTAPDGRYGPRVAAAQERAKESAARRGRSYQ